MIFSKTKHIASSCTLALLLLFSVSAFAQTQSIQGVVKDAQGIELIGVNVRVSGQNTWTVTNEEGKFTIAAQIGQRLDFSFIGFFTQQVVINDGRLLEITMQEDIQNLDELLVVGYGTNTKRSLISSVSQVHAEELENLPITNITQGLVGRSPGLIIKSNGGGVNKTSNITIRGGGTPLIVIDGVIRSYADFQNINPDDIEAFSILKDASATAVYGSRAGNGIIQITTKKGKIGAPEVNYSFTYGLSQPNNWPQKLNSWEIADYRNQAAVLDGLAAPFSDSDIQKYKDGSDPFNYPNTDWQSTVLNKTAPTQKHNITLSGGSETNQYYMSLGYIDEGSLYKENSHWNKRYNVLLSNVATIKKIGLKITGQLDGYINEYRHPYSSTSTGYYNVFSHINNSSPMALAVNQFGLPYGNGGDQALAEISLLNGYDKRMTRKLNGMLNLEWNVPWVTGLKFRANGAYMMNADEQKIWRKDAPQYQLNSQEPSVGAAPQLTKYHWNNYTYTLQYLAEYGRTFGKHTFNVLGGYEASYGFATNTWAKRQEYQFEIDQFVAGPSEAQTLGGSESETGRAGFVGQLRYNYNDKYYVEGGIRHDASVKFAPDKRWGTFFSGSLGWLVSEEGFFQGLKSRNIINMLKLRASYGEVGLDTDIADFFYLTSYSFANRAYVVGGKYVSGFSEGALPSPDATWYTTRQTNIGLDFASLNDRLFGSVDYFYYATTGYLTSPSQLEVGYTDPLGMSLPKVHSDTEYRRAGWEFQLGYQGRAGDFEYSVSGNFTHFDSMYAFNADEAASSIMDPYKRSSQQRGYYGNGYHSVGFYNGNEDVLNSVKRLSSTNLVSGDLKYEDFNGDGVIDGNDQNRMGKSSFPRGNYGLTVDLRYKGFFFNMLWQGSTNFNVYASSMHQGNNQQTGGSTPIYEYQSDFWTSSNTNATYPRLVYTNATNGSNNLVTSDFWLINGRYLRLKDLQIGYDFKKVLLKKATWISRLNVVLSGQNLLTFSQALKYGMDPETNSTENYGYPLDRTFALSVNIGF